MFKKIGLTILFLAVLFTGYLYWQALNAQSMQAGSLSSIGADSAASLATNPNETKLAFGSCNRQDEPQTYWPKIAAQQPNAWIWLGDNIYGDSEDPAVLKAKYQQQKTNPYYQAFTQEIPVYGIWDDHDYGLNDGGKEWSIKDTAASLMLDFLGVPATAEVRSYPGTYQAVTLGEGERTIRLILLDTRYFRDPVERTKQGYLPNSTGDILGEEQWKWLTQVLADSSAAITLIASSIQVLPEDHAYEKWANFPTARQRLLDVVERSPAKHIVFLSGDRHLGEMSRLLSTNGRSFYEVTSSGLTHSYTKAKEENRHRIGALTGQKNYGLLSINWSTEQPSLLFQLRSIDTDQVFNHFMLGPAERMSEEAARALFTFPSLMPTALKPCPESPNCVSTQSAQSKKKRDPLVYTGDAKMALQNLKEIVGKMARTKLVNEEENYLHFEFTTFPIPFVDDVEFLLDDEAKVIHYRSASRVGYSDLGANGKRMKKIAQRWAALDQ